ncbi:MAG TPA: hypothetical protein VHX65_02430, partial [Pirellulales bacterium]|nr:hypothetical protein [Pirellulales bacterium]
MTWVAIWLSGPSAAFADGGTVRFSERHGNYVITAFTSPTPLRAGPVDISVLVQDAASGEPASDVAVVVRLNAIDQPQAVLTQSATAASATNKLFRAALFELPWAGRWRAEISISGPAGPAETGCELEVGDPLPAWLTLWP